VLDSDGDFVDDRLYVGDIGGQVWRVDLGNDIASSGGNREGSSVIGRLANISATGSGGINERRFFEPPSVVQVEDNTYASTSVFDYVLMGTGWRAHPLNKTVHDRFYAFRDRQVPGKMTDADSNNLADSYPSGTTPANTPINNANLIDVTNQVLQSGNSTHEDSLGWYFDFEGLAHDGEKVLSAPVTIAGSVFFTTYQPDVASNTDLCSAQIGGGNAYNFNVLNAGATIDWDLDGTVESLADRALSLGGGIPSDVVPVFTKEGIVGIVGIEGGAAQLGTLSGLPRFRTYWYEEPGD
jgi:type IV pilus assembly protein PilY1